MNLIGALTSCWIHPLQTAFLSSRTQRDIVSPSSPLSTSTVIIRKNVHEFNIITNLCFLCVDRLWHRKQTNKVDTFYIDLWMLTLDRTRYSYPLLGTEARRGGGGVGAGVNEIYFKTKRSILEPEVSQLGKSG